MRAHTLSHFIHPQIHTHLYTLKFTLSHTHAHRATHSCILATQHTCTPSFLFSPLLPPTLPIKNLGLGTRDTYPSPPKGTDPRGGGVARIQVR